MLVLSGKPNERFFIGDEIEVVVVESGRGVTRLGFVAPHTVKILREKVYQDMRRERNEALRAMAPEGAILPPTT